MTERTKKTDEVRYRADRRYYKPTVLVNLIAEQLTDEDYKPSEIGYWLHPRHGKNFWELRSTG